MRQDKVNRLAQRRQDHVDQRKNPHDVRTPMLNERYSDVTFRMMVVRSAKGDNPTTPTLQNGASGNKMLDTFGRECYLIPMSICVKITAPNQVDTLSGIQTIGSGVQTGTITCHQNNNILRAWT